MPTHTGVGELFGSVVRAPSEAVKSRVQSGVSANAQEAAGYLLFDDAGRRQVVRAWSSSLLRDLPFGALQLAIFETVKASLIANPGVGLDVNTLAAEAAFGALGGVIAALVTAPADVVTTQIL